MCTCASCEYTDSFSKSGFDKWPRGEPAGAKSSAAAYTAHASHAWAGVSKSVQFKPGQAPRYPAWCSGNAPIQPNATAIRWNTGRGHKYVAPVEKPAEMSTASLLRFAQRLREQARAERKALKIAA